MNQFGKFESQTQLAVLEADEHDTNNKKNKVEIDNSSYRDFICEIKNKILDIEKIGTESYEDFLKRFKKQKDDVLREIDDIDKKTVAEILFGVEEVTIEGIIERSKEERINEYRISWARWQHQIMSYINSIKNNSEKINIFWDEYDALFKYDDELDGEINGKKYKAGILSSLALQNILSDKYGMEIIYPTPEDDVECQVDMIALDKKRKTNILIQIKGKMAGLANKNEKKDAEKNKWTNNDEGNETITVVRNNQFASHGSFEDKVLDSFARGCYDYINKRENKNNFLVPGYKTIGLFIDIPHTINGKKVVKLNGTPDDELWAALVGKKFEEKLGLPNVLDYDIFLKRKRN